MKHFFDRWLQCVSQFRDMARENGVIFDSLYSCADGAATLMTEYEDQGCPEHCNTVFKAGQPLIGDEVASDAYGEKIASSGVKSVLGGDARVRATQYCHERVLPGYQRFSLSLEVVCLGGAGNIPFISLHKPFKGHIRAD